MHNIYRGNILLIIFVLLGLSMLSCTQSPNDPTIKIWHGLQQKIGHLGDAQPAFNLMGEVSSHDSVVSLNYQLNNEKPVGLSIGRGRYGFKRNAGEGFFNADIPIEKLKPGINTILLTAKSLKGSNNSISVSLEKLFSEKYPLPLKIDWTKIANPQNVGQYVDGEWVIKNNGLKTVNTGYDRIFLIGDKNWQDYEVQVPVTINNIDKPEGAKKFKNGMGILFRFTGHVNGGHRNFVTAQPKHGYQPFGAIGWLRWKMDKQEESPKIQFYSGYTDKRLDYGDYSIAPNETHIMKMRCETFSEIPSGDVVWETAINLKRRNAKKIELAEIPLDQQGITQYSFKIWKQGEEEPQKWSFQITQISRNANRNGAFALLAHHVNVTFGNVTVRSIVKKTDN